MEISYHSCRNRLCSKCQSLYKAKWLENRQADLLPVKYLHSVFTLPHELNALISANKRILLNAIFTAVKHSLTLFSKDPKYGWVGQLGFTSVLHTWDQKMNLHYHLATARIFHWNRSIVLLDTPYNPICHEVGSVWWMEF